MNKEDVTIVIRSILSSIQWPLKIYKLNDEFKSVTGSDIPLFEYDTLQQYLQSISDTVLVTGKGTEAIVSLVRSNKSAHIVSLVDRQRNSPKNVGRGLFNSTSTKDLKKFSSGSSFEGFYKDAQDSPSNNTLIKYEKDFYKFLISRPYGATFDEIKENVPNLKNLEKSPKLYNILNLVQCFPFCLFYGDKFYAVENFKKKICNDPISSF